MAFNFKHASVAGEATREFNLGLSTSPGGPAVLLIVRHAGEPNKPYWNAAFKRLNAGERRATGAQITPDMVVTSRAELIELYAKYVIVGWRNVTDTDTGQPVEFSPDGAQELLAALSAQADGRTDVFDELTAFCRRAAHFAPPTADPVDVGKG
jgi:hypothetical protein